MAHKHKLTNFAAILLTGIGLSFNAIADDNALCQEGDNSCTFVLWSQGQAAPTAINAKRANSAKSPFSTFKVANSVIGLDTGVIPNLQAELSYDKSKYPAEKWWPSVWRLPRYTLSNAFKFSVVPIYRQLAVDIGKPTMVKYLKNFDYGNQDISSGLDQFWLNGSMKISAMEQVTFLKKLNENKLALKPQSVKALKQVMVMSKKPNETIYAKTGAGKTADTAMLGWQVGFVENKDGVHYFALNFDNDSYKAMKSKRVTLLMNHLKAAGLIK